MVELRRKDKNTEKQKFEDNDRVVANMNIDGMPFSSIPRIGSHGDNNNNRNPGDSSYNQAKENDDTFLELNKKELRRVTFSATLAGLLIGLVFLVVFFLFVMFCIYIWF